MNDKITDPIVPPVRRQRLFNALLELLPVRLAKWSAKGLRCERGVVVKSPLRLKLGRGVVLQRQSILHCGGRKWSEYKGGIELGDYVVVGPGCVLYGAGVIRVGKYTHFGPGSMVMTQSGNSQSKNRQSTTPGHVVHPVVLGDGVWVGAGAVILGGSNLGDNCNIGPNSVVSGSYPAGTTLIGNPARAALRRGADEEPE